jgi:type IV pilus assembly protein PilM
MVAAAVLKSTVSGYMSMLRHAGFKLKSAAPMEYAFSNIIRRYEASHPSEEKREYCIIDLGHTATRLYIYTGSSFSVTKVIDIGGDLIDSAIADEMNVDEHIAASYKIANKNNVQSLDVSRGIYHNIAIEIMRAINFYGFNNPESNLTDAYYCGGGAKIPLFLEEIANTVKLNLHSIEELMPGAKSSADVLSCAAAAGIALQ